MQNEAFDLLADSHSRKFLERYRLYFYEPSLMDSGVHPTLHSKCFHQIVYSKLNLKVEYTPSYTCQVCDYGIAHFGVINRAIENLDRNKFFSGHDITTKSGFDRIIFKFLFFEILFH